MIKAISMQKIATRGVTHVIDVIYLIKFSVTSSFNKRLLFDAYNQLIRNVMLMRNIFK
jgi:hypothetical protein